MCTSQVCKVVMASVKSLIYGNKRGNIEPSRTLISYVEAPFLEHQTNVEILRTFGDEVSCVICRHHNLEIRVI